jgi:hypothetical protein
MLAAMGARFLQRAAAFCSLLLVAGCVWIDEPPYQGPPEARTAVTNGFTLTADAPVVVRTLEYRVTPGAMAVAAVESYLGVVHQGAGGVGGTPHDDVWISIINAETGRSSEREHGIGHASVDGWGHSPSCDGEPVVASGKRRPDPAAPCSARWTVIVRWLDPRAGTEIPLELHGNMRAIARAIPSPSAAAFTLDRFAITAVETPSFAGAPALTRAQVTGSRRVTPSSVPETTRFVLRVPAALLGSAPRYPRLGRIFVGSTVTDWSGQPSHARVKLSIRDRETDVYGSIAGEFDWLDLCDPGADCELPVDVTISFWESVGSGRTAPPNGFMALQWRVEARLEDFSAGAAMPASLELVAR